MNKRTIIVLIILVGLILGLGVFGIFMKRVPPVTYAAKETDPEAHWGTITGSLGYPSDGIPPMGVCAETAEKHELYCTYEMLEGDAYTYGIGYALDVPPGDYRVFAHLVDGKNAAVGYTNEKRAYYSQFVKCGMDVDCASHKAISVRVGAREQVSGIDPIDW